MSGGPEIAIFLLAEHSFGSNLETRPVMLQQLVLKRIQEEQAGERRRNEERGRSASESENSGGLRGILVSTVNLLSDRNCGDSSTISGSTKLLRRVSTSDSARSVCSMANETHHRPAISKRDSIRIKRSTRTSIREQREMEELDKMETKRREAKSSLEESLDNIERGLDNPREHRLGNGKAKQRKPHQKRKTRRVHSSGSFHNSSCVSFCPSDAEEDADSSMKKRSSRTPSKTAVRKPKHDQSQNRLLESWNSSFGGSFNNSCSFDPSRGDFWAWK